MIMTLADERETILSDTSTARMSATFSLLAIAALYCHNLTQHRYDII
jgi:hypothetical protein